MQYAYTSLRGVIGQVIRNTRIQDSSFIADIHEWLYEAMDMMQTNLTLEGKWEDLNIVFHKAKLPCKMVDLSAVEYNGRRLREGGSARPADKNLSPSANKYDLDDSIFFSVVDKIVTSENHLLYNSELIKACKLPWYDGAYYYTEMGYINTSFATGKVTIYYKGIPLDVDGLPVIPDNANYRQALYWYARGMMIGAGFPDKQFTFAQCMHFFDEVYAPRALSEIRMASPEQMEHRVNLFQRLLPNEGYYDSFFQSV